MEYFNNVFSTFIGLESCNDVAVWDQKAYKEQLMTEFFCFWVN